VFAPFGLTIYLVDEIFFMRLNKPMRSVVRVLAADRATERQSGRTCELPRPTCEITRPRSKQSVGQPISGQRACLLTSMRKGLNPGGN
jgi:hypothetical protein